jgi:hypothetical protein
MLRATRGGVRAVRDVARAQATSQARALAAREGDFMRFGTRTCALLLLLSLGCDDDDKGSEPPGDHDSGVSEPDSGSDEQPDAGAPGDDAGEEPEGDAGPLLPPPPADDPWDDVATSVSADIAALVGAMCDRLLACKVQTLAGDREACVTALVGLDLGCAKGLETATLTDLAACTGALASADCEALAANGPDIVEECDTALDALDAALGLAAEGEACGSTISCGRDLSCTASGDACGMCMLAAALPGVGADCPEGECALGAFCAYDTSKCTALLDNGGTCDGDEQCTSNFCDADGKCGKPNKGDACEAGDTCGDLFVCVNGKCGDGGQEGDACSLEAPCTGFLVCTADKCAQPVQCGQGAEGDPCVYFTLCGQGLYCDTASSLCTKPVAEAEECDWLFGIPCADGLTCTSSETEGDPDTCQADPSLPGAACTGGESCASGRCVGGVCSAGDTGESCFEDRDCASGACDFDACTAQHEC